MDLNAIAKKAKRLKACEAQLKPFLKAIERGDEEAAGRVMLGNFQ